MMYVEITDEAEDDLNNIFNFIARWSEHYAHSVTAEIRNWCDLRLSAFPYFGPKVKDIPAETRQTVGPYGYAIRYMIVGDTVHVTMIYKNYK